MDPTRSSDNVPAQRANTAKLSQAAKAAQSQATRGAQASTDASDSVALTAEGLDQVGRAEVARVDDARLSALREAVRSGSYEVDAEVLADRLLDDAFGD